MVLVKHVLLVIATIVILAMTAWSALVLLFAGPGQAAWARASLAALYLLLGVGALIWLRPLWRALALLCVGLMAVLIWWGSLRPSNEREWQPDVAQLSWAEVHGDRLRVHNVRNFDYRSGMEYTPLYEDRDYDLSKLRGLDLFMSYWGSPAIAHTIVSWDFGDALRLAISIETRKRKGQEYSAIQGFFRQYEIIYVAADERDVVRLRTNYRNEQVYLYRIKASRDQARAVLLDYVASMNALIEKPEFYNALLDNCTTSIYRHVKHADRDAPNADWRLLVNGYGDEMLYEQGLLDTRLPFAELRARSRINTQAKTLDRDPDFSHGIRMWLPKPET
jgi:hypothetical protein